MKIPLWACSVGVSIGIVLAPILFYSSFESKVLAILVMNFPLIIYAISQLKEKKK